MAEDGYKNKSLRAATVSEGLRCGVLSSDRQGILTFKKVPSSNLE
jgi:hypothetical protein